MRIYYTTDFHGSVKCWKKFLVTPEYYNVDVIIMGGDITGKFIVPLIRMPNGRVEVTYMGNKRRLKKEKDVEKIKQQIADAGQYALEVTLEEYERYQSDPSLLDSIFAKLLSERVQEWMDLADERLRGKNVRALISAGNDDLFEIDEIFAQSEVFEHIDGKVVDLGEGFELLGLGYSNITPWNCPRDLPEEELRAKIDALAAGIQRMDQAIFCIHVPPYNTGIDEAPELTEDMQMIMSATGEPQMIPVGSKAVREAILEYQPMLGLHGHIHESSGIRKLGRTTIANPGSEYAEGILRGLVIDLDPSEGITNINLVAG